MKRRLLNLLTALSLLLFVATVALWVRSYRVADYLTRDDPAALRMVVSWSGEISLISTRDGHPIPPRGAPHKPRDWNWRSIKAAPRDVIRNLVTFRHTDLGGATGWMIEFPHWALLFTAVVLPAAGIRRSWRRRRRSAGLCPSCGYDLRASPDRCPECGMGN